MCVLLVCFGIGGGGDTCLGDVFVICFRKDLTILARLAGQVKSSRLQPPQC